jgi:hypothetical protein
VSPFEEGLQGPLDGRGDAETGVQLAECGGPPGPPLLRAQLHLLPLDGFEGGHLGVGKRRGDFAVGAYQLQVGLAGLQPGEVEQRVDQAEESEAVTVDHLQPLGHFWIGAGAAMASSSGPSMSVSGVRNS